MATKDDLIKTNKKLRVQNLELKKNNDFLMNQQKEFKGYAEDSGSKLAKVEHQLIVLTEKYEKVKSVGEYKR